MKFKPAMERCFLFDGEGGSTDIYRGVAIPTGVRLYVIIHGTTAVPAGGAGNRDPARRAGDAPVATVRHGYSQRSASPGGGKRLATRTQHDITHGRRLGQKNSRCGRIGHTRWRRHRERSGMAEITIAGLALDIQA